MEIPSEPASTGNPPLDWDVHTGRNVVWSAPLGNDTFGAPVIAGDAVFIGTSNSRKLNPAHVDECGTLMTFKAATGEFLWQDLSPRVKRGLREFLLPSTSSTPYVEGDRLYYVTSEAQLRCLDKVSGKMIWELDMVAALGVFVHEAPNSGVLALGDMLIVSTSNGRNEGHTRVPSPRAPSLIAVDKKNGSVIWRAIGAGANVLHGQWSTPRAANVGGRVQVLHGGGDGWLRAYDAASGREIWRFDGNPKDSRYRPRPEIFSRSAIVHTPVFDGARVYIAMGEDPSHGNGPSLLHAISPNGQGDVTNSRLIWTSKEIGRVVGTPIVQGGLLYVADLGGTIHCLDAATGVTLWKHETDAAIWGCLTLVGNRLYAGNALGKMVVLRAGRTKDVLSNFNMRDPLYACPAVVGDSLYIATSRRLFFIAAKP
jgi:outer membrane protein assembly factor BamB